MVRRYYESAMRLTGVVNKERYCKGGGEGSEGKHRPIGW